MGQAKQRGSFEQRKALAVERDNERAKLRAAYERTRLMGRVFVITIVMIGLIAGAMM